MRVFYFGLLAVLMGAGEAAEACWACDAGLGEECYLANAEWATAAELARMDAGQGCSSYDPPSKMAVSNGALYTRVCVDHKIKTRQDFPGYTMKTRKIGTVAGDEATSQVPGENASSNADIDATSGSQSAMMQKARGMVTSAAPYENQAN